MRRLILLILPVLLLTSCGSSGEASSQTEETVSKQLEGNAQLVEPEEEGTYDGVTYQFPDGTPVLSFEERFAQITDTYPDKTVLIWALDTNVRFENELNEYLAAQGKDYVICFDNIVFAADIFGVNGEPVSYTMKLDQDIAAGAVYDIIGSGGVYMNIDGFRGTYRRCAEKGYFVPLDSFLEETDAGKRLYSFMPGNYWETLRIDGSIYGFDGELTSVQYETGFEFNTYITEKESIDPKDFSGSCCEIAEQLIDRCRGTDLMLSFGDIYSLVQQEAPGQLVTQCVYIEDGEARNLFESEEAERLFNTLCEGFLNGNIYPMNKEPDPTRLLADARSYQGGGYVYEGSETSKENGILGQIPALLRFPDLSARLGQADMATGIYSGSAHKDMAFDALATVMSDPALNDLLCFGPDREYTNGAAVVTPESSFNTLGIENLLLRSPRSDEDPALRGRLRELCGEAQPPEQSTEPDLSAVEKQVSSTNMTVINIPVYFPSEQYSTGSQYLEELNRQLYEQGLQDIIDEINRQLEDQK